MPEKAISINRAPVLTLWAAVVAERLGFSEDEALSLGKVLAGLAAQAKGRRLGIYQPHEEGAEKARERKRGEEFWIELMSIPIPAKNTEHDIRAVTGDEVIEPESVTRYLRSKFGEDLDAARSAMRKLARAFSPSLAASTFLLLLLALAASSIGYWNVSQARNAETIAHGQEIEARQAAETQLRQSLLTQAAALRQSTRLGRRQLALEALRRAAQIAPGADVRSEYLRCLDLADMRRIDESTFPEEAQISSADRRAGRSLFRGRQDRILVLRPGGLVEFDDLCL